MGLPDGVDEILPLTPAQAGMLFHVLENPQVQGRYIAVVSCHIDGPLDIALLQTAMQDAVAARDAYRASFVWEGVKQPIQAIRTDISLPWETLDWSQMQEDQSAVALERFIEAEQRRRFDLTQAPLMAVNLIRRSDEHHILVWSIHHLISDGWSTSVVFRDIFRRYVGAPAPKQTPARFRDAIVWARSSGRGKTDTAFWAEHLAGLDAPSQLDLAAVDPARVGHGHLAAPLGSDVLAQVTYAARSLRITQNTVLCAAWALTLRHMLSRDDIVFGQTFAGRSPEIPGISEAAGAFINTLPLRLIVDPHEDVTTFLIRMEAAQRACAAHEFASLSEVQSLAPVSAGTALFDTLFVNEGMAEASHEFGSLKLRDMQTVQSSNYTLAMLVTPHSDLKCELYFDRAKVSDDLSEAIFDCYTAVLRTMLADLSRPVHTVALAALPDIVVPKLDAMPTVLSRFLACAAQTPDAPAVSDDTITLSYRALLQRASSIANALDGAGVGPDQIIPVALERGPDTLAAFLAIWMAGAAYVPLDLTYPKARLSQILEAVKPRYILARAETLARLPEHGAQPVLLETVQAEQSFAARPGNLAYVIFTSGSQGKPKGVVIAQDALARSLGVRDQVYGETPDAFLLLSSLAFDSSVPGLYWPLATGGHVIIPPHHAEQNPAQLGALISKHKVTHTLCLPSLAQMLLNVITPRDLQSLKVIIPAGERLPPELCIQVRQLLPNVRLMNEYGPTEATVWATAFDATHHEVGTLPIGKALPGTWVGICDADGAPLPAGVVGEIVIAGPTLASGYLSDADQTASAFPVLSSNGLRIYCTGDLGHADISGVITFLGRADDQVKIRGHRVELGEIEAVAQAHLHGDLCIALVASGTVVLCIQASHNAPLEDHLKSVFESLLPDHFRPTKIHWQPDFPKLPNGKVDIVTLAGEIEAQHNPPAVHQTPPSEVETQISGIFAKLLSLENIPLDANFFDLGGDSLKTIAAYGMARDLGLSFSPTDLFDHPTVRSLARFVMDQSIREVSSTPEKNIRFANLNGDREAFFIIHGTTQFFYGMARGLGERHPVGILFSDYLFRSQVRLNARVEDLAYKAVEGLRKHRQHGPYVLCAYSAGAPIALEMARILGDEVVQVFLIDPPYNVVGRNAELASTPEARRQRTKARFLLGSRIFRHSLRVLVLKTLEPFMLNSEWLRRKLVQSAYVFSLSRYRVRRHDGPVRAFVTVGNPSMMPGSVMDTHLTQKEAMQLNFKHADVIATSEGVLAVSTRIISWLRQYQGARK